MRFPEEIVAERFVPTVRALLVAALEKRGLRQGAIAQALGISQSAVSKYQLGKFQPDRWLAREPRLVATVERVADGLATKRITSFEALGQLLALVREFENRGPICAIHEDEMPSLRGTGCDLCIRGVTSDVLKEQRALGSVRRAAQILEAAPGFAAWIPHVGTNVAEAVEGASDATHVAALPGGFIVMKGAVRTLGPPELGVSQFMGEIALTVARASRGLKRAALNVRTGDAFLAAARTRGLAVAKIAPALEREPAALADALSRGVPDVFYHEGDFGIEPQTYLVAASAREAAELVSKLLSSG